MKFYVDQSKVFYLYKIISEELTAIYINLLILRIQFFKSGLINNEKNAAITSNVTGYIFKQFWLNNILYGYENDFTKESWRRFVKMKVFL
jgi:hypothetical protein